MLLEGGGWGAREQTTEEEKRSTLINHGIKILCLHTLTTQIKNKSKPSL